MTDQFEQLARAWAAGRGDFVPAVAAKALLAELRAGDDERLGLYRDWLAAQELSLVTGLLKTMRPARRSHAGAVRRPSASPAVQAFQAAVATADLEGADGPIWKATYRVGPDTVAVCDMTSPQHEAVAGGYQALGARSLMLATFHRRVARLLPSGKTTKEVLTEEKYLELRDSIARDQGIIAPAPLGAAD